MTEASSVRVAILIPMFKHPALVVEAIESALSQNIDGGVYIVLINDGCPFRETDEVCKEYQLCHPDMIRYIRKKNGGLSAARNTGILYVLANLPSVEAIYMLDADNRLLPSAMARAMLALDENPEISWIYPNIDMFGLDWRSDFGGPYSLLVHSETNICEAGSLIRRSVFEAGVLFDTEFKLGWEDWDFFLTAARRGFVGKNIENFGFRYRKRPESMLADSNRDQSALRGAMRLKHKPLYQAGTALELEEREAPRYAIHCRDTGEVLYCVDPLSVNVRTLTFECFERDYWASRASRGRIRVPPINIVMSRTVMHALARAKVLHWALWKLELMLANNPISLLSVGLTPSDRMSAEEFHGTVVSGEHTDAVALAMSADLMEEVLKDGSAVWINSIVQEQPDSPMSRLKLDLPSRAFGSGMDYQPAAVFDTLSLIHRMRGSRWRAAASFTWSSRANALVLRGAEHAIVRDRCGGSVALPRTQDGGKHIGFLLPLVEFGGVEKVALQMAKGLRAHGWVPHAFVLQTSDIAYTPEWSEVFESTTILTGSDFVAWGDGPGYLGTPVPHWSQHGNHGPILGMLHWLSAVVNFHGGAVAGVMGPLRRMGIKTVNSLHLNDQTRFARPSGNTYLGIAYEHAFDIFAPCSRQLSSWLHAMGVPQEKIVPVINSAGFDVAQDINEDMQKERVRRADDAPLRVLYLGRLDRQKGLARLSEVFGRIKMEKTAIEWRFIGSSVLTNDPSYIHPDIAEKLEPALSSAPNLTAVYNWADVIILLSSFEGLPLTLIEAMRAGVVVIATDVGAVSELVSNDVNGVLVPLNDAVERSVLELQNLASNRERLRRLSGSAFEHAGNMNWVDATKDLSSVLVGT